MSTPFMAVDPPMRQEYRDWALELEQRADGWYYRVSRWAFVATYGPFVGPSCAESSGMVLIDVLEEQLDW